MPVKCVRLGNIRRFAERHTGFYTKKGCIETATEVGKRLVDIKKTGRPITKGDCIQAIEQCAPHIRKPKIATSVEEYSQLLDENGADALEKAKDIYKYTKGTRAKGWLDNKIKGFCLKFSQDGTTEIQPDVFAHEFEHFVEYYANLSTVLKRFLLDMNPLNILERIKYKKWLNSNLKRPDSEDFIQNRINIYSKNLKNTGLQEDLFQYCGVSKANKPGIKKTFVEGYKSTSEEVTRLFQSPLYNGLSSNKDINKYIRSIIRHSVPPDRYPPRMIKNIKMVFDTEVKAYEVSDNVVRYSENQNALSVYKIRSEILRRAAKIERRELWLSRLAIFRRRKRRHFLPELPPIAVNG